MKRDRFPRPSLWAALFALAASCTLTGVGVAGADESTVPDAWVAAGKSAKPDAKGAPAAKPEETKPGDDKPFDAVVKDMETLPGLFTFYRRADDGKVYLEIQPDQLERTFLFTASVDRSVGERGFYAAQMGADFPFVFHRVGKNIQWIQKNVSFRAQEGTPEARATARSFPDAILASAKIQSKPHAERKSLLVDVQELFGSRDLPGFAIGLNQVYQPSTFSFDKDKSSVTGVKVFPENVLVDLTLHFQTDNPRFTTITLADARSLPISVKYGLSALPAYADFRARVADDRIGHFHTVQQDFTTDHPKTPYLRYINRWNLEKQDPAAAVSAPKHPIVFWLENTIPVEYRGAVRDGALLWNKAFEKIGFKDAVVVKQQPDDADWDAADVRYNTIRWFDGVDATFAIGPSRANPYTGQIYDADISISEGIVRNARRNGEELVSPVTPNAVQEAPVFPWSKDARHLCSYADGLAGQAALGLTVLESRGMLSPELETKLMYEYIVELTAHEVGHTLGLRHNFRGSSILPADELNDVAKAETIGQSSSVMDYNPVIIAGKGEKQGHFVPVTLGPYDYWAIEYAYKPLGDQPEAELAKIASRCTDPMLPYSTDEDAIGTYSPLSIDPLANQYDQSTDPLAYFKQRVAMVNELWGNMEHTLAQPGEGYQIMRRALGRSLNEQYRSLVTSSKFVGGLYHVRDHVGDPGARSPFTPVPAAKQREALDFLAQHAFGEHAFELSPSLMNKLAVERLPGLDPAYFSITRLDFPWHDNVLRIQKAVLDRLLHPVTLGRIQDNELRFRSDERVFRMADLFTGLNGAIWSELDGTGPEISSLRRNLQREHLKSLLRIALRQPTATIGLGAAAVPVAPPEDATTLARAMLVRLQTKIRSRLAGKTALETTTRAHLQETLSRISATLDAHVERRVD